MVGSSYVAHSPLGMRPSTAPELRAQGRDAARLRAPTAPATTGAAAPGTAAPAAEARVDERLRELQRLLDEGLINEEEFARQHERIVDEL